MHNNKLMKFARTREVETQNKVSHRSMVAETCQGGLTVHMTCQNQTPAVM